MTFILTLLLRKVIKINFVALLFLISYILLVSEVQIYYLYLEYKLELLGVNWGEGELIPKHMTQEQSILVEKLTKDTTRGTILFFGLLVSLVYIILYQIIVFLFNKISAFKGKK